MSPVEPSGKQQYSDKVVLDALRNASAAEGEPLSADSYGRHQARYGGPTSVRIIQRFGTWNHACAEAGLRTNPGRPSYRRGWTDAEMLGHVADYLRAEGSTGSYAGYDAYARTVTDAPSAQSVRNRFTSWASAKSAAQDPSALSEERQ